ncbi:8-amino-7-oxononanoate synthase [Sphingomonas xinjiangensis]|uniref:8-amino-7-oxononanoate synthase n=1 Tax=Sphingomonas xinjiangensis TaxID=643568 RepID=A0A840YFI3_9SPHN|nr:8-amino-7-oxononanoate synthase [Sphingomonas xinjiangensis]MBB5709538.1 8-amino-7-oxononanoate synthase [Sphingomonas xinjiangensis]
MSLFPDHAQDLAALSAAGRRRSLIPRSGRDFASNDYLGLAGSPRLATAIRNALERGVPIGSGGSRLLRGNHPEHEALEAEAASFFGSESALFLSSGYAANALLFATLPQRGDLIVHDELVHASAHEGMRLSRAIARGARHNDVDAFAHVIAAWRREGGTGRPWIAVESLYSMDGDKAPLARFAELANQTGAVLLIDEAHATGVFGPDGQGLAATLPARDNIITLHTCGKALGCEGALIAGPAVLTDFIVNRGRAFIFSTAPSPIMAAAVRESVRIVRGEPDRRERLHALIAEAHERLTSAGAAATGSHILPLVLGDDARTMRAAAWLQARGFDVRGIRPPTVPPGTARLRISLTLNISLADLAALAEALPGATA